MDLPEQQGRDDAAGGLSGFAGGGARLLNAILDAMEDDHIYVTDREGRFVYISAPGARALGWNRAEKLGKTPLEAGVSPEAIERDNQARPRIFAGETITGEMHYDLPDGRHDYEYTASPIPGDDGKPHYLLARLRDVTGRNRDRERLAALAAEQAEAMRAAQEGEARFQTLAQAVPGFVWTAPQGGRTDWMNRYYWEFTGMPDTIPLSELGRCTAHPDDLIPSREAWAHAQATGQPFSYEVRIKAKDGNYRWFLSRAIPQRDADGAIVRWFGVTTDIDAQKRAQMELEALNVRLKRAMAETHHRVKNNLQVVAGLLELEATGRTEPMPPEELARFTQHVRALAAVHDLLTDEAKRGNDGDFVEARAILEKLLPTLQSIAGDKRIDAHLDDARLASPQGTSLALIANELIHNAIKHGATCIDVRFAAKKFTATLVVADDGPGFPAGFDPALDAHTGLELVRHLSEWDLHGTVSFDNRPQGGARVTVTLPIPAAPERSQ